MSPKPICENCLFAQWIGSALTCTNDESEEYLFFVLGIDKCNEFEDEVSGTEIMGAA